jgi:hypothetical protein
MGPAKTERSRFGVVAASSGRPAPPLNFQVEVEARSPGGAASYLISRTLDGGCGAGVDVGTDPPETSGCGYT